MNDISISCIVTCYNGINCISDAIMSAALAAQYHPNDEVVIVDDCSTDGSKDLIEHWTHDLNIVYGRQIINSFTLSQNVGVSGTRNIGIEKAKGDYICFLDMDDLALLTRNFLYRRAAFDYKDVDIFYGKCFVIEDDGSFLIWEVNDYLYGALKKVCYLPAGSILIKKSSFKEFFDTNLKLCGDYDFYLRAEIQGKKFFKIPTPLYTRRVLPTSQGVINKELMEQEAEEVRRRYWKL